MSTGRRGDGGVDGLDPGRVVDAVELVHHAVVVGDGGQPLARLPGPLGQAGGQRQAPDRRQVGPGGPGEVEPVGRGLGRRLLVGQHVVAGRVGIGDGQRAEHAGDGAGRAGLVGERHGVAVVGGVAVGDEDAVGQPLAERGAGGGVAVGPVGFGGDVDDHDVVGIAPGQRGPVLGREHVVGRGHDGVEIDPRRVVADAGERLEAGHAKRLAHAACQDRAVTVVLDLDGVVWLADRPIPGAADAVARLRAGGHRVVFVSNNSFSPVADVEEKLAGFGIPAAGDVLTSAVAAARLVQPGERVFLCAGPGAAEALAEAGAERRDRRRRRRRGRRLPPQLRLRGAAPGVHGRAPGRPADRHQRRRHLPDARRAHPGRRRHPGRGGGRLRGGGGRGRQAVRADGRPGPGRARAPTSTAPSWWATGPTPTAASPGPSAAASAWCSPG